MNRALAIALAALLAGCHEGAPRGADQSEIDHPLQGAWKRPNDVFPGRVFFHGSRALDDGDLHIFPGVSQTWTEETVDSIIVDNVDGPVSFAIYAAENGETLVDLVWAGRTTTLQSTQYLVNEDGGAN